MQCRCTDIHTHVVPADFPKYVGSNVNVPWPSMEAAHSCHKNVIIQGKNYRTVSDQCWLPHKRLADMKDMGLDLQALSPMPELLSYWLPLADAKVLVRYVNDQIAGMVDAAPDHFVGLGGVPLQDVDAAIQELEYLMKVLKFRGVELASHVNGVSIGDPRFEPFFAAAVALDASIFVHALRPAGKERIVGNVAEQVIGFPIDIALAAASMITGGIASRHKGLRIAFSHGGGALPIMLPRMIQGAKTVPGGTEVYLEPADVTAKRFYYDSALYDPKALRFLIEVMGTSQVVIGSDYPFWIYDRDPVGSIKQADLAPDVVRAITSGNAQRFLGLTR